MEASTAVMISRSRAAKVALPRSSGSFVSWALGDLGIFSSSAYKSVCILHREMSATRRFPAAFVATHVATFTEIHVATLHASFVAAFATSLARPLLKL